MSKIYTRTGDKGETSLVSGSRVLKGNIRIDTYGEVDELNSHLGVITSSLTEKDVLESEVSFIRDIQNNLFNLGSNLACEKENREKFKLPKLSEEDVQLLEKQIDLHNTELSALKNFILPGGALSASYSHVARTVCRRLERKLVSYAAEYPHEIPENSIEFINRLSDYLFSLSRFVNLKLNEEEILWKIK